MDKDNIKTTLTEYLNPLNHKLMLEQIKSLNLDKYVKKLDSTKTVRLFIFAQLMKLQSYTDISLSLKEKQKLQKIIGLETISYSQLSRKLRDMDPDFLETIFKDLTRKLFQRFGAIKATRQLGQVHLIDASTISLCLTKYRWAEFRKTKAGVKLHLRFIHDAEASYPDEAILTPAKPADKTQMDALVVEDPDALNIFDRGYVDYQKFDEYCAQSIRFITRLKSNANIQVLEEKAVVDPATGILREAIVRLGNKYTYLMEHPLRLIESLDSEGNSVMIITNDFHLFVEEISQLYRNRWQIELFFKWIKQHLHVKKCYGTSKNAVYNQIRIALITFCLTLLMKKNVSYQGSLLNVFKLLRLCWDESFGAFIKALFRPPTRHSKGRRSYDHERIFTETLQQYEVGMTAHLDDLEYDPML